MTMYKHKKQLVAILPLVDTTVSLKLNTAGFSETLRMDCRRALLDSILTGRVWLAQLQGLQSTPNSRQSQSCSTVLPAVTASVYQFHLPVRPLRYNVCEFSASAGIYNIC